MKTNPITIATTNSDKHLSKISKEFLFDLCRQINNDPKQIYVDSIFIGLTVHAKVKVGNRLQVKMDVIEELPFKYKNIECFFIPVVDEATQGKKGDINLITGGKLIGINMVREHTDKSIRPTVFGWKLGVDYLVFDGQFLDKESVNVVKESNKVTYVYYPGAFYTEEEAVKDAREKGMMHENLEQTISPFSICHDPPEKTFTEFKNRIESDIKDKCLKT